MFTPSIRVAAFALGLMTLAPSAWAQDPSIGFPFGYTLGYQSSFRNRLPTPPYFSVYPPVYYGRRYQRPYGDSPYAAFPQLGSVPGYAPYPRDYPTRSVTSVANPYSHSQPAPTHHIGDSTGEKVADAPVNSGIRRIVNPYAQPQVATQENN